MKKRKIIIKKSNLKHLSFFLEEKNITLKNIPISRIYCESIYFGEEAYNFLAWNTDSLTSEKIELLIKLINTLLENTELVYEGDK